MRSLKMSCHKEREYPSWPQHSLDQKVQYQECSVPLELVLSSWGFCISQEVPSAPFRIRAFYTGCVTAPFGQQNSLSGLGSSAVWGKTYCVNCCYRMQLLTCTWLSSNRGCEPNVSPWTPKEALRAYSLGRTRTGLSTLWCLRWQNALPAFEQQIFFAKAAFFSFCFKQR